jgi:hypothetical protein
MRNLRGWIFRVGVNAAKDLQRNTWRRLVWPLTHATHAAGNGQSPPENRRESRGPTPAAGRPSPLASGGARSLPPAH